MAYCVPTPAPEECKKIKDGSGPIADPSDPHKFFMCAHGHVVGAALECGISPSNGGKMTFDPKSQVCVDGSGLKCPQSKGLFPYPGDKHKYIECGDGTATVGTCPTDLVFLPKCSTCGYEDDKTCGDGL